jgi:hypothetical protein
MKTTLALLLVVFLPVTAFSQWTLNGLPLTAASGDRNTVMSVSDGAGGVISVWDDQRFGVYDIYAQRVTSAGVAAWTAGGVAVCNAATDQYVFGIASDGAGGAIISWQDARNGTYDIYVQRVNASGVAQWTANGVNICNAAFNQSSPRTVADGSGGAIVVWQDLRSGNNDVYVQRVNASGVAQWTANGVALCTATGDQDQIQILSVGSGGAIVVWRDFRYGAGDTDIFAIRVSLAGAVQWAPNGVFVCGASGNQSQPTMCADGAGGALMSWSDLRSGSANDIFAERMDTNGNALWAANGVIVTGSTSDQVNPFMISDGSAGAVIAWMDLRTGDYDVYVQHVSAAGANMWTADGLALCAAAPTQYSPTLVADGAGGYIATWQDERGGFFQSDIYAQRLNATGAAQWASDGIAVASAASVQASPALVPDGAGGTIMTWADYRGGLGQIYAGRIDNVYGFPGHPEPVITSVKDVGHDQGGKVAVNWTASSDDIINPRTIGSYSIWRAVQAIPFGAETVTLDELKKSSRAKTSAPLYLTTPGYYFERVGTQSAHGWPGYSFVADTRADSLLGATNNEVFMVAAHNIYDDFVAFASNAVSGHSVDNLAPLPPLMLTAMRIGPDVKLKWNRVHVPDLRDYAVYRKTSTGVTPVPINFLESANDTLATDASAPASALYYIVTAYDMHSNQSGPSNEANVGAVTGVGGTPASYVLSVSAYPNPFNPETTIRYTLPARGRVTIHVFDARGAHVATLVDAVTPAGAYTVTWNGHDDRGNAVGSGVFFARLASAAGERSYKMTLLK